MVFTSGSADFDFLKKKVERKKTESQLTRTYINYAVSKV